MNLETSYRSQRRVEFADTDMAGIVHFTNYLRYMEETEHAFLRDRGLNVVLTDSKGKSGFPKLSVMCQYQRPARYDEVIDIVAEVACRDGKSIEYEFRFIAQEELLAQGTLRVAFCRFPADGPPYAVPLPEPLLDQLFEPGG